MKTILSYIREQNEYYQQLLEKAENKQQAIIQNDLQTIEALNKEEEQLITEAAAIENKRIEHIEKHPEIYGEDALQLTLEELKLRFSQDIQEQTDIETKALMETLARLKTINNENAELLKQALRMVNVTINTIAGNEEPGSYSKEKGNNVSKNKHLFDKKI